jgi:hypothetical protein
MVRKHVACTSADQYVCHLFPTFYGHALSGRVPLVMHDNWLQIPRYRECGSEEFRWAKYGLSTWKQQRRGNGAAKAAN